MAIHGACFLEFCRARSPSECGGIGDYGGFWTPEVNGVPGGRSDVVLFLLDSDVFVDVLQYLLLEVLHPFILVVVTRAGAHVLYR